LQNKELIRYAYVREKTTHVQHAAKITELFLIKYITFGKDPRIYLMCTRFYIFKSKYFKIVPGLSSPGFDSRGIDPTGHGYHSAFIARGNDPTGH